MAKKTAAAKKSTKTTTAKKAMTNGEPVWSDKRVACVKAMRKLRAFSEQKAATAGRICEVMKLKGVEPKHVKTLLDVYRKRELLNTGYAKSIRHEGSRELAYYLTDKGRKTTFK